MRGLGRQSSWSESAHRGEPAHRRVTRHERIPADVTTRHFPICHVRDQGCAFQGVIRDVEGTRTVTKIGHMTHDECQTQITSTLHVLNVFDLFHPCLHVCHIYQVKCYISSATSSQLMMDVSHGPEPAESSLCLDCRCGQSHRELVGLFMGFVWVEASSPPTNVPFFAVVVRGSGSARWPDCIPSSELAQGVLLIPVSGREVGVVCGGTKR